KDRHTVPSRAHALRNPLRYSPPAVGQSYRKLSRSPQTQGDLEPLLANVVASRLSGVPRTLAPPPAKRDGMIGMSAHFHAAAGRSFPSSVRGSPTANNACTAPHPG